MSITEIGSIDELHDLVGKEVALTEWFEIAQERILQFAEATEDRQWIHVDVERARLESPFGTTIAHGFLTLSLLPHLLSSAISFRTKPKMGINYGLNKVRFTSPVPAGARIRGRFTLKSLEQVSGVVQIVWDVVVECEGLDKPCCVAEWVTRRYE